MGGAGGSVGRLGAQNVCDGLRGHGESENRPYWVRAVSLSEDRRHGRKTGPGLSLIRNLALNLLRAWGYRFVVDGFRALSAQPDRGLSLLVTQRL